MVTSQSDLARLAGVSVKTVTRAFQPASPVSQKTRLRIHSLAARHGYAVNRIARGMVKRETDLIGFLVEAINWPAIYEVFDHLTALAKRSDRQVLIARHDGSVDSFIEQFNLLAAHLIQSMVIRPPLAKSPRMAQWATRVQRQRLRVVVFGDEHPAIPFPQVSSDVDDGAYRAAQRLIAEGHRRIALVNWNTGGQSYELQQIGYRRAMTQAGFEPIVLRVSRNPMNPVIPDLSHIVHQLVEGPRAATAAVFGEGSIGEHCVAAILDRGIDVPDSFGAVVLTSGKPGVLDRVKLNRLMNDTRRITERIFLRLHGPSEGNGTASSAERFERVPMCWYEPLRI